MAGATINGPVLARAAQVRRSSAMPTASLAITLAVHGAMTKTSPRSARAICSGRHVSRSANMSKATALCESVRKVSSPTNSVAARVMTTETSQSRAFIRRTSSAAL
jgi:hypothetical protein